MTVFGFQYDDFTGAVSVSVDSQVMTDADGEAVGVYGTVPTEALAPATATALLVPLAAIAESMGASVPDVDDAIAQADTAELVKERDALLEANAVLTADVAERDEKLAALSALASADGTEKTAIEVPADGVEREVVIEGDPAVPVLPAEGGISTAVPTLHGPETVIPNVPEPKPAKAAPKK